MTLPRRRPLTGTVAPPLAGVKVPSTIWNFWVSAITPSPTCQRPSTFAGMMNRCEVHQLSQPSVIVCVSSGVQSLIQKVLATMRVPGGSARNFAASFSRLLGSRKSASTVAFEMSA